MCIAPKVTTKASTAAASANALNADAKRSTTEGEMAEAKVGTKEASVESENPVEFRYLYNDEPHATRRMEILKKYPEIKRLYGPDIRIFRWCIGLFTCQLSLAYFVVVHMKWGFRDGAFWLLAWAIGGTLTQSMSLGMHELSHNLCFATPKYNEWLGMFLNCAQGIPAAVTFKRYHLEHHIYQGDDVMDTDLPVQIEVDIFGTNTFMKIIWMILQPLFYLLRPPLVCPKPFIFKEGVNFFIVGAFNLLVTHYFGIKIWAFNVFSGLLGMGLHPCAGHFIAEHYTFAEGQETYSYYGPLNYITFNVGYHNEHHDFPTIAGFRLPEVKAIAPEYYDERCKTYDGNKLVCYNSWCKVIFDYIFRSDIGPHSRIKRSRELSKKNSAKSE